jgi:phosphoribosyl 1,2-cyclic phosphodiesterase/CheY-like chemotaxis protein
MARVLVVDDDPIVRTIMSRRLQADGHEVSAAADGEAGWNATREGRPDVVILDLMMPKMHGYAVIEAIRREPGLSNVRIVVCSMKGFASDSRMALNLGADRFLMKPVPPDQMAATVKELAGEPTAPEPAAPVFRVRFWGTRGSIATPGPATVRYGGNTSCTEVRHGEHILVFDAGTGLRELGESLLREFRGRAIRVHLFVGHTHWDHIQGFPFFTPAYIPGNEVVLYSARAAGKPLEKIFGGQMDSDYFPVLLSDMRSSLRFVEMSEAVDVGPVKVRFEYLNHPGIAIGFRVEAGGRSIVYLSDHERFSRMYGEAVGAGEDLRIAEFARGADLLISEAQYTTEEYASKRGWGHSTFEDAVRLAADASVRRLAIFHHDPSHDDDFMDRVIEGCREEVRKAGHGFECFGAREGQTVDI